RVVAPREEEDHAADGADAADADHLDGVIDELVPVEQDAPLLRQRVAIALEHLERLRAVPEAVRPLRVVDQRGIVLDSPSVAVDGLRVVAVSGGVVQGPADPLAAEPQELTIARLLDDLAEIERGVPRLEHGHRRVGGGPRSVASHRRNRGSADVALSEASL